MVGKWTESRTLKFIYYYRLHECLWNTKSEFYSMKEARSAAYADLVIKMEMPDFDVRSVKVKIKNLRAQYISEFKKKRQYAQIGRTYEPTVYWFKEMDSFLREIVSELPTMQNPEVITADSIFDCSSIYENGFIDEDSMGKASPIFHMEATSRPAIPTPPPKKQYKPGPASRYKPGPASKKRKRPPPPVIQEKTDDEFEVFGKSVAVQLRMLSLSRALRAQTKIQAILTEERILELETRTPSPEPLGPVITEVRGGAGDTRKMNGASSNASITSHDASSPSSSLANIPAEDTSNADEARASSSPLPLESSVAQSSTSFESSIAQSSASSESSVAQSSAPLDSSVAQSSASLESPVAQSTTVPLLPVKTEKESEVKSTLQEPDTASPPKRTPSQEPDAAPPPKRTPSPESRVSRKTTPKLEEPKPSSKPNYHIIKAECEVITLDEDDPLEGFG